MAVELVSYPPLRNSANLVAYWRLDGNSLDETANNNDGTDTAITYGTAYGKFGQGALFNGSTSKIAITTSGAIKTQTFTYLAWVNSSSASYRTILGGSTTSTPQFRIDNNHKLSLLRSGVANVGTSTGTVPTSGWHLVGVSYDGTNYKFSIDGVAAGNGANAQTFSFANFNIGQESTGGEPFNGSMDEVIIFNSVISVANILAYYNATPSSNFFNFF